MCIHIANMAKTHHLNKVNVFQANHGLPIKRSKAVKRSLPDNKEPKRRKKAVKESQPDDKECKKRQKSAAKQLAQIW